MTTPEVDDLAAPLDALLIDGAFGPLRRLAPDPSVAKVAGRLAARPGAIATRLRALAAERSNLCDRGDLLLGLVLEREPKLGPIHEGTAVGHVDVLLHDFAHAELTDGLTRRLDGGRCSVFP